MQPFLETLFLDKDNIIEKFAQILPENKINEHLEFEEIKNTGAGQWLIDYFKQDYENYQKTKVPVKMRSLRINNNVLYNICHLFCSIFPVLLRKRKLLMQLIDKHPQYLHLYLNNYFVDYDVFLSTLEKEKYPHWETVLSEESFRNQREYLEKFIGKEIKNDDVIYLAELDDPILCRFPEIIKSIEGKIIPKPIPIKLPKSELPERLQKRIMSTERLMKTALKSDIIIYTLGYKRQGEFGYHSWGPKATTIDIRGNINCRDCNLCLNCFECSRCGFCDNCFYCDDCVSCRNCVKCNNLQGKDRRYYTYDDWRKISRYKEEYEKSKEKYEEELRFKEILYPKKEQ